MTHKDGYQHTADILNSGLEIVRNNQDVALRMAGQGQPPVGVKFLPQFPGGSYTANMNNMFAGDNLKNTFSRQFDIDYSAPRSVAAQTDMNQQLNNNSTSFNLTMRPPGAPV